MTSTSQNYLVVIGVAGVGSGGANAVSQMIEAGLRGVEFIIVNTDAQALPTGDADIRLDIGRGLTRGLDVRADPFRECQVAEDHSGDIEEALKGTDMVFVMAGEEGGIDAGAAPIVVKIARSLGALTIGVVTRPFSFEGRRRATQADSGIEMLREEVDTLIVVPNDRLLQMTDHQVTIPDAFEWVSQVLMQDVSGITDLITTPGLINLDFTDVRSIMNQAGSTLMDIGSARSKDRARAAAEMTISSLLLEASIDGAHGVLLSIAGGSGLGLLEVSAAAQLIEEAVHDEANIISDTVVDDVLGNEIRITVITADFDGGHPPRPPCLETTRSSRQQPPQPRGGFGSVSGGGPSPLAGGTPLTGNGDSRLAPPHVTPMSPTRLEPQPLRAGDDDDLGMSDFMK